MCGIAGYVGLNNPAPLQKMLERLQHRGPDAGHQWGAAEVPLFLGHRRLSILDLAGGGQPMVDRATGNVIVFNGEIYNHAALKAELVQKGHFFSTAHSDTETLLKAYAEWGEDCQSRLNGMWAFVLFDRKKELLFCSRDRFGEKPFYYRVTPDLFVFASELSAFEAFPLPLELDLLSVQKYFGYGYIPEPRSLFKDVKKLPHGSCLTYDIFSKKIHLKKYWDFQITPDVSFDPKKLPLLIEECRSLLDQAVSLRLMSDVPVGVFLSGGLDSSSVAYFASRHRPQGVHTFSMGFLEASFNELPEARKVAQFLKTIHREEVCDLSKKEALLARFFRFLDEPLADASLLPTSLLAQFTAQHVKVALSGDGGDELFAGYDPFLVLKWSEWSSRLLSQKSTLFLKDLVHRFVPVSQGNMSFRFKLDRLLTGLQYSKPYWLPVWMSPMSPSDMQDLFHQPVDPAEIYSEALALWQASKGKPLVDRALEFFTHLYFVNDILVKSDRAGMWSSLEVRSVFTDVHLVEFAKKLPWPYKFYKGTTKFLLKKSMEGLLPQEIIDRKKKGFGAPVGDWMAQQQMAMPAPLPFLKEAALSLKVQAHHRQQEDHRLLLWSYFVLGNYLAKRPFLMEKGMGE